MQQENLSAAMLHISQVRMRIGGSPPLAKVVAVTSMSLRVLLLPKAIHCTLSNKIRVKLEKLTLWFPQTAIFYINLH